MTRILLTVVIFAVAAIGDRGGRADEPKTSRAVRTFHIGNSLTDTLDGWLEPLSKSAGRELEFHRFTIPGAPTDWLWDHPGAKGDANYREAFAKLAPLDHVF